ncbi:hypothetical protein A2397_04950 [Candidatus Amesbacteria bacterium RIFOXYB1_FULL_44_23]|uniref:Uncharacterized protein n=1 Tax=Candidatus Amesbacteria bacterium RIFOXYB1_FULL_44_23 TaxID=1797263 RepID=A0A1F4ZU44_9BACT|nr:MAG: hypothetical protein A2397_04950 [Candidatus Amesbacteria bacterium RIFOXYB1_FULL_44_23]
MKSKDVVILESLNPIKISNTPNKRTTEYIARIINSDKGKNFLINYRKLSGIPENGLNIRELEGVNYKNLPWG